MKDISGKTAIVTGAASGIGLGIATALAEAGANVVMADIQKDAVEEVAHGLSGGSAGHPGSGSRARARGRCGWGECARLAYRVSPKGRCRPQLQF